MSVTVIYRTASRAYGGRDGRVVALDGGLDANLTVPKEMGGPGGTALNPEKLFAAGYAACFLGAMKYAVSQGGFVPVPAETTVTVDVGIGPRAAGGFGLDVEIHVAMPGTDPVEAQRLVDQAHQICPYSNATRDNVAVRLAVV